jgi:hypothetical protein
LLACFVFPSARIGKNPTGHFTWDLVGFAITLGLVFALCQSLALLAVAKLRGGRLSRRIAATSLLWIATTAAGIFAMIFPLWSNDAWVALVGGVFIMAPGIVLMAALQATTIRPLTSPTAWLWRTAVGAAAGAFVAPLIVISIASFLPLSYLEIGVGTFPAEVIWAATIGLSIGVMQYKPIRQLSSAAGSSSTASRNSSSDNESQ